MWSFRTVVASISAILVVGTGDVTSPAAAVLVADIKVVVSADGVIGVLVLSVTAAVKQTI